MEVPFPETGNSQTSWVQSRRVVLEETLNHLSIEVKKPEGFRDRNLEERSGQEMCPHESATSRGK